MAAKKRSKGKKKKMPQRGCLLSCCLLWLMLGGLAVVLSGLISGALLLFPAWKKMASIPDLQVIFGLTAVGIGAIAIMGMLQFIFAQGLWRWHRWGLYGLLIMEAFGIVFSVLSLVQDQIDNLSLKGAVSGVASAGIEALSSLLPVIILWFLLRPHWKKMK